MLRKNAFIIAIGFLPVSAIISAKPLSLTDSCAELINIYASKNEKHLLAAQTTSLSESLRAGYCLGVIDQYAKSEDHCRSDWFKRAEFIAKYALEENSPSEKKLLRLSCEI
ncbi:hypothetical protein [Catenovulum sediminis]|uniref:hypothetical protein n=1 Tax=Catenovulum sediminis TaxID=1740262 RepID=UPI00117F9842|nr:hypothetical protein [Catenovulum sediminis]